MSVVSSPVRSVGIYAPGGSAAYPSSVLMCALPARAPGVRAGRLVSPPGASGKPGDAVLAACAMAGVDEVYSLGGAQAIAALAYGTESVAAVDLIVGPGNRFVTEAKRQVSGAVGIDALAGPSELFVVADGGADPSLIALDVLAQAEHGDDSPLVVVSPDAALLDRVGELVEAMAAERPSVADAPLGLVVAPGIELALSLADAFAPEHLELAFAGAHEAARGRVAGCVFVGPGGATAFGDYAAGSNHVLPTGGAARFGGPLGPGAFLRRTSIVSIPRRRGGTIGSSRRCGGAGRGISGPRRIGGGAHRLSETSGDRKMARTARIERETSETKVALELGLDGGAVEASTGVGFFDHMLDLLGRHGRLALSVEAEGDLETGAHHTVEDIGIAFGQALDQALGDRAGIRRYGHASCPWTRRWRVRDRHLRPSLLPLRVAIAGGLDRRLRHRAGGGVLSRRRLEREAHPAHRHPLRIQRPPPDRGVVQGLRAGAAGGRLDRSRRERCAEHEGDADVDAGARRDPRLRHGEPEVG